MCQEEYFIFSYLNSRSDAIIICINKNNIIKFPFYNKNQHLLKIPYTFFNVLIAKIKLQLFVWILINLVLIKCRFL